VSAVERVQRARRLLAGVEKNHSPAVFGCGFRAADMVVLDILARDGLAIDLFTIDTGELSPQTHALIARVRKDYGLAIRMFAPWPESVDALVEQYGLEAGQASRAIRFDEPLTRALAKKRGWVTARRCGNDVSLDAMRGIWTFSPLAGWSQEDVREYLRANRVPWNGDLPPQRIALLEEA
jgi:phosphoadenosine phosphosulfate reductase